MSEERRTSTDQIEGAYVLAILYTLGYLAMMGALMAVDIPTNNREILLTLVGIMSAAQLGIIKYYYDGSRGAEKAQAAGMARASRTEAAVQEIAKAAAPVAAAAVAAATGAAVTGTGNGGASTLKAADTLNVDATGADISITDGNVTKDSKP